MPEQIFRKGLSPEARRYAVKELARRAGVGLEFFDRWTIDVSIDETTVRVLPDGNKAIVFPHASSDTIHRIAEGRFSVAEVAWPEIPNNVLLKHNLVVPFLEPSGGTPLPLFQRREDGAFLCTMDLLLSLVLTLARFEESVVDTRDQYGRFPASASISAQYGFLERPIVDEYGLAFEQILSVILPSWKSQRPGLRVKLTHDIDTVGIPCRLRTTIGHTLRRKRPAASLKDFASVFSTVEPAELALIRTLVCHSKARGLHSAFFWNGSPPEANGSGYDPFHPKVQGVIASVKEQGFELGVQPGYNTFGSRLALRQEVERLREALGVQQVGGRQHYLRWCPQTWLDWESCGLTYDSTVGFADSFGFRAGTAIPFRPWSFCENRELNLLEVPLVLMDCTAVKYMALSKREGLDRIRDCIQRVSLVGGVFTLLWHNTVLLDPEYDGWYDSILDLLSSAENMALPDCTQSY